MIIYILIGIIVLALDMITKYFAVEKLMEIRSVPIIEDVFHLTYIENSGVAFGLLAGKRIFFITLSFVILVVLAIYFYKAKTKNIWLKLGTTFIFSGSIGNLIERIFKGYVVDFLDLRVFNFPVFNVADIAVCIGSVCLLVYFLFLDDGDIDENNNHDIEKTKKSSVKSEV